MVGIITNQVRGRQDLCGERLLLIILGVGDIFQQSAPIWEIKIIIKMEYLDSDCPPHQTPVITWHRVTSGARPANSENLRSEQNTPNNNAAILKSRQQILNVDTFGKNFLTDKCTKYLDKISDL